MDLFTDTSLLGILISLAALGIGAIYLWNNVWNRPRSSSFSSEELVPVAPPREAVQVPDFKEYTIEELKQFNGENNMPILIALKNQVYHVSCHPNGRDFYGPGNGYHAFAGRDASRALATMKFDEIENRRVDDLNGIQRQTLQEWVDCYRRKYRVVGQLVEEDRVSS